MSCNRSSDPHICCLSTSYIIFYLSQDLIIAIMGVCHVYIICRVLGQLLFYNWNITARNDICLNRIFTGSNFCMFNLGYTCIKISINHKILVNWYALNRIITFWNIRNMCSTFLTNRDFFNSCWNNLRLLE
jgi:hypothetical protein